MRLDLRRRLAAVQVGQVAGDAEAQELDEEEGGDERDHVVAAVVRLVVEEVQLGVQQARLVPG